jgi:hypothetical protein
MPADDWSEAVSFEDLCHLSARFLSGEVTTFPGWMATELEEETEELAPVLVPLNLAGLLTVASQRGHASRLEPDGRNRARRSFVMGFASPTAAESLARAVRGLEADLRFDIFPPALRQPGGGVAAARPEDPAPPPAPLPVGLLDGEPFLVAGHDAAEIEREIFKSASPVPAIAALARCPWVSAVDLAWEDRPMLWEVLAKALVPPAPPRV